MGVYIPGMEMPTSCSECLEIGWHYVFECRLDDMEDDQRLPDCPLVPVPEHGRLGDLDDFAKRMKNLVEKAEGEGFDLGAAWYSAFVRHIELTPTIIPADPAKESGHEE